MVIRSTIQQILKQIFVTSLNIFVINRNLSFHLMLSNNIFKNLVHVLMNFLHFRLHPLTEQRNLREGYKSVMTNPAASGNISSTSELKSS